MIQFIRITLLVLLTVSCGFTNKKDNLTIKEVTDTKLAYLLNSLKLLETHNTEEFTITVYEVFNESGSAGYNNCEVSSDLYIAISSIDETPEYNLFKVASINFPNIKKWENVDTGAQFTFTYKEKGETTQKTITLLLSMDGIQTMN